MAKLCILLLLSVLGAEVFSMSFRVKRQNGKDLEDRYGYPTPNNNENNTQSPEDCRRGCPVTSEYNPVCGTDNVTYPNPGRLLCAQACGTNVTLLRQSRCPPAEAPASTPAPSS